MNEKIKMQRDAQLRTIRPAIPAIQPEAAVSDAEKFQNETLRPILKLQNDLLLATMRWYIQKRKGTYYKLHEIEKSGYLSHSIRNDQQFRNLLTGMIIGHFTLDEWKRFEKSEPELRKRLVNMLVERVLSQRQEL